MLYSSLWWADENKTSKVRVTGISFTLRAINERNLNFYKEVVSYTYLKKKQHGWNRFVYDSLAPYKITILISFTLSSENISTITSEKSRESKESEVNNKSNHSEVSREAKQSWSWFHEYKYCTRLC